MAGNTRSVTINILGNDADFQKMVKRVQGSVESLGSLGGKVNAALGIVGAGATLDYVINQNEEAQKAEAQLAQAVKTTGDAVGYSTGQLKAMAEEMQKTTGFSTAQIEEAQALGLTYTHIGHDVFPDFIKAAADMATRMGVDLTTAVRTLGKALNDPAQNMAALKREGIDLTKTQQEQITYFQQTNQLAKAQGLILAELQKTMGGAATNAGDLGTQLKGLANDFGDAVTGGNGIGSFTEAVTDMRKELQDPEVKSGIQGVVSFFMTLVSWAVKAAGSIAEIGKGLGVITGYIATGGSGGDQVQDVGNALGDAQSDLKILNAQLKRYQDDAASGGLLNALMFGGKAQDKLKLQIAEQEQLVMSLQNTWDRLMKAQAQGHTLSPGAVPAAPAATGQTLAEAQAAFAELQAMNATALAELDQQYKAHNISIAGYFAQRVKDEQKVIDAEIALKQKELAQSQDDAAKQAQLQGEIITLEQKRKQAAVEAATAQAEAEKRVLDQLEQVRIAILRDTGDTAGAAAAEIKKQYEDLLKQLAAEGNTAGIALVHKLINVDVAKAQLQELEDQVNQIFARLSQQQQQISNEQNAGILNPVQAAQEIADANKQAYASAAQLVPQMQALADSIGDPKMVDNVKALAAQVDNLRYVTNQWIMQIEGAGENALAQFFDDMIEHTKNLRQAFEDMVQSFTHALAEMASQALAHQALMSFMNAIGYGPGSTTTTTTAPAGSGRATVPQYAEGGEISGPGGPTDDRVHIKASPGEWVIKAAAARKYGTRMMDAINRMVFPDMPAHFRSRIGGSHFAEGGMVAGAGGGGDVLINVHNYSGEPTSQSVTRKGNDRMVDITIGTAGAKDIASGGALAKSLESTYGLTRRGAPRRQG